MIKNDLKYVLLLFFKMHQHRSLEGFFKSNYKNIETFPADCMPKILTSLFFLKVLKSLTPVSKRPFLANTFAFIGIDVIVNSAAELKKKILYKEKL